MRMTGPHEPRTRLELPRNENAGGVRMLLAGEGATEWAAELLRRMGVVEHVPTMLEAVLLAREPRFGTAPVIAAGVAQEIEQLEAATRALRKVYPQSPIYLLCDPADEVRCRKCSAWGATDYLILPLDAAGIETLIAAARPAPAELLRKTALVESPVARGEIDLAGHTELLLELAAGQADIATRAVALLQSQGRWGGSLRYVPADPGQTALLAAENAQELRAAVTAGQGSAMFGTLVAAGAPASLQVKLDEAAAFVGSLLAVAKRYEQLRSLAITDELSGAYNRRYFTKFVSNLLDRARESRFRVTLLLFDIDDFKKYNDRFGHASGDAIIRELIKLLRACTRPHDLVARVGGDEFAVVFWDNEAPRQPNSEHPRDAIAATERFRKAIQTHQWPATCNIQGEVSISGGLASFPWDADTLQELMAKADEALLRAKSAGKNAILLHAAVRRE